MRCTDCVVDVDAAVLVERVDAADERSAPWVLVGVMGRGVWFMSAMGSGSAVIGVGGATK